jgi:hypothetical protein
VLDIIRAFRVGDTELDHSGRPAGREHFIGPSIELPDGVQ